MKKQGKKTVGVYDRPEKRNTKPIIIAVGLALILLVAIFLARAVYSMPQSGVAVAESGARQSAGAPVPGCDPPLELHWGIASEGTPLTLQSRYPD